MLWVLGLHRDRGGETLSISMVEDERRALELCSLASLGPPLPITHEELIGAYHLVPVTILIKSNVVVIPHL